MEKVTGEGQARQTLGESQVLAHVVDDDGQLGSRHRGRQGRGFDEAVQQDVVGQQAVDAHREVRGAVLGQPGLGRAGGQGRAEGVQELLALAAHVEPQVLHVVALVPAPAHLGVGEGHGPGPLVQHAQGLQQGQIGLLDPVLQVLGRALLVEGLGRLGLLVQGRGRGLAEEGQPERQGEHRGHGRGRQGQRKRARQPGESPGPRPFLFLLFRSLLVHDGPSVPPSGSAGSPAAS